MKKEELTLFGWYEINLIPLKKSIGLSKITISRDLWLSTLLPNLSYTLNPIW